MHGPLTAFEGHRAAQADCRSSHAACGATPVLTMVEEVAEEHALVIASSAPMSRAASDPVPTSSRATIGLEHCSCDCNEGHEQRHEAQHDRNPPA